MPSTCIATAVTYPSQESFSVHVILSLMEKRDRNQILQWIHFSIQFPQLRISDGEEILSACPYLKALENVRVDPVSSPSDFDTYLSGRVIW